MRRVILCSVAILAVGCSSEDSIDGPFEPESVAVVANADIAVGPSRLLVGVVAPDGARLGSPEAHIAIEVAPADHPAQRQRTVGAFTWILEPQVGLYRAEFVFDRPGEWILTVVPDSGSPLQSSRFAVQSESRAPAIGEEAPLSATPTVDDAPIAEISTDPDPDPRLYSVSLDQAVRSGGRTVAIFSTPAYCNSVACGPMLDQVKQIVDRYPSITFVHVEIYEGWHEPGFVPDGDHLAPAVGPEGWNLPTEPWVFVVDEEGTISHRFEGVLDPSELIAALG